jgi:four helix bundle protein
LEIWKISIEIAKEFCLIAEKLEKLHLNKFSEYLQNICICISNNIAEISGSHSEINVTRFLTNAHLLTLESENIVMILYEQKLLESNTKDALLQKLDGLENKILNFQQAI